MKLLFFKNTIDFLERSYTLLETMFFVKKNVTTKYFIGDGLMEGRNDEGANPWVIYCMSLQIKAIPPIQLNDDR